jgi:hypothetical protein
MHENAEVVEAVPFEEIERRVPPGAAVIESLGN